MVVIIHKGDVFRNLFFPSFEKARNYVKFQHPKRRFKEPNKNELVCARYGTTFKIKELDNYEHNQTN